MKQNVLIVDDQPANLVALEAILEEDGRQLIKATSGNQALSLLLKNDISLVLLDVQMPEMDGFEVAELMRMNKKIERIPIIFLTAISKEDKYVFRGYKAGAVDYLFKPVEPLVIKSKVDFFLELDLKKRRLEQLLLESQTSAQEYNRAMEPLRDGVVDEELPDTESES